jgi:UDP-galactopyranose mutase
MSAASSIDARLDVDFTRRLAALAADRQLVLYGRVESPAEFDRLCREQRNIVYRGEFRYGDIATILQPFGIALAPYAMNALTQFINPDKFYYFLNSGMEVISTDIPQARRMRHRIHIAKSPEDVLAIVDRLQRDPAFRKNTAGPVLGWDQRAGDLLGVIARTQRVRGRRRSGHPPP